MDSRFRRRWVGLLLALCLVAGPVLHACGHLARYSSGFQVPFVFSVLSAGAGLLLFADFLLRHFGKKHTLLKRNHQKQNTR